MFIEEFDRIRWLEAIDRTIQKLRIPDDVFNELFCIAVIGDVASALAGDIHLPSGLRVGIQQYDFVSFICAIECEKQSGSSGTDTDDPFFLLIFVHARSVTATTVSYL